MLVVLTRYRSKDGYVCGGGGGGGGGCVVGVGALGSPVGAGTGVPPAVDGSVAVVAVDKVVVGTVAGDGVAALTPLGVGAAGLGAAEKQGAA